MLSIILFAMTVNAKVQSPANTPDEFKGKNFEMLYAVAKDSYLANDWKNCVSYMEQALLDYRLYHSVVTRCKIKCRRQEAANSVENRLHPRDVEGLHFYEEAIRNTLCIMRCKRTAFGGTDRIEQVSNKVLEDFEAKAPYDYLQLCYFQVGDYQRAASAAFTNLVYNPGAKIMEENLEYYIDKAGADRTLLVNFEAHLYVSLFLAGCEHYRKQEWRQVRVKMEEAVSQYLLAEEECRFSCEKPFDMGWFPDFITSVANHFTFCLRCKRTCHQQLSNLNGEHVDNIFPLMFHYLQISYFNEHDLKNAAKCTQSYLLLHPDDQEMLQNKEYYLSQIEVDESWFVPRNDVLSYYEREVYETKLMSFVETSFNFDEDEPLTDVVNPSNNAEEDIIDPMTAADAVMAPTFPVPPPKHEL